MLLKANLKSNPINEKMFPFIPTKLPTFPRIKRYAYETQSVLYEH